jgi:squalene-hopene/tetraprenyl-beta-curcumene cyclase
VPNQFMEADPVSDLAVPVASRPSQSSESSRLEAAVQAAQRHLLSLQAEDGHWCGELEGDTILESEYILAMHFLGRTAEPRVRKAAAYLRRHQRAEGGWAIYPGGPPEVSASVKAYFVLKLIGDDPGAPHMENARRVILDLGGLEACNSFTKIYLAIFGQYPWTRCPSVPPELILFPRWVPFNIYEMSSWSRGILVPLSIISARRPRCAVPERAAITELFAATPPRARRSGWSSFFYGLDAVVKQLERGPFGGLRRRAIARAERWTLERLEGSDGIGAIFPPIVNTIFALGALGYPLDHPLIQGHARELEKLELEDGDTLRVQPCFSPVWDTAYVINALTDSGVPGDHPAIERATRWALARRGHSRGDWAETIRGVEHPGWYFEYANPFYPDCDTTSMMLTTLAKLDLRDEALHAACQRASFEAMEWLLAMQNKDGGWAAFDRGCDWEVFTKVPFADHNAMIDPSTEDLTSRVLTALAGVGYGPEYPAARRGIEFLRRTQEPDGSWYGRWGCNYIYGTYLALWGLNRIGVDTSEPWIQRGVRWLEGCQNPDGGWGETLASYQNPALKGKGPSTASQTAWAVLGLLSAGAKDSDAVHRGIRFLLARQTADGSWPEPEWTGTGFPLVFYLRYHLYPVYFPLMALAMYARITGAGRHRARATRTPQLQRVSGGVSS